MKMTHEDFMKKAKERNNKIIVIGEYISSQEKILVECKRCHYQWYVSSSNILHGFGCPECQKCNNTKTNEEFLLELSKKNDKMTPLEEYKGVNIKIKCVCNKCGEISEITPHNLLNNRGCNKCRNKKVSQSRAISNEDFLSKLQLCNPNVLPLEKYKTAKEKIKCLCLICNQEFYIAPDKLYVDHGCPHCNLSKGESKIKNYLDKANIKYKTQKTFSSLRGLKGGHLSYDFYIEGKNILLEFQGKQHEKPVDYGGGIEFAQEYFKIQQEHDKRKKEYAKNNGYKLLEIWYYDFDKIEEILSRELSS